MQLIDQQLAELLAANPQITLAYLAPSPEGLTLHVHLSSNPAPHALHLPAHLRNQKLALHRGPSLFTLIAPAEDDYPMNDNTECQNEPVQLGCQIQPATGDWLGTAGAPVKWTDPQGQDHWGILSNWHVMADSQPKNAAQYQPDRGNPNILARLADSSPVSATAPNEIDAAIADALIAGHHTIAAAILGFGLPTPDPISAAPGLAVTKSGRTTGLTSARCSATNAAVKVGYGNFQATFVGQDVFQDVAGHFSDAGDSGSLILATACRCPCSLLFAGGGTLTIGNPIKKVVSRFNLSFAL